MAYNTKAIKTDVNGNPISQYYNPETDEYEPVEGAGGGNAVILYNEDGTPNNSLNFGEILDKLDQLTGTVIAEQTRQQNEVIRQQNEQQRIDLYNALKDLDVSQYELRLQNVENQVNIDNFLLEEWDEPVISLPSNATNGQINEISIFGNTEIDEDNVKSTFGAIRLKSVGKNLFDGKWLPVGTRYFPIVSAPFYKGNLENTSGILKPIKIQQGKSYSVSCTGAILDGIYWYDENGYYINRVFSYINITPPNNAKYMTINIRNITNIENVKLQIEVNNTTTEFEDYKESTLYVIAKDEEGNILELRSLPNGTKDEIDVANRKLIKRIGEKANVSSSTVINFADMAEGGTYFAWNENGETETGTKGGTLGIDATVLTYQLAQPIEIPIDVLGNLQSYENGTVYIDTIISKVNFYDGQEGITVTVPIKAIDTLYKVDKETGYLHPLDISQAVIAEDGLSFTHPELADGDLVDWDYVPDVESTNPAISMKLPTNLKASVNSLLDAENRNRKDIEWNKIKMVAICKNIQDLQNEFNEHKADFKEYKQIYIPSYIKGNKMKYIGHRGVAMIAPENTIPSFEKAGELGFWATEADCIVTKDGEWVILHDTTVDRMTNGTGNIQDMTLSQVRGLIIDAGANINLYPNLKIPTLEEFLDVCLKWNLVPIVETKGTANASNLQSLIESIKAKGLINKVIISSLSLSHLTEIRSIDKNVFVEYAVYNFNSSVIDTLKALGNAMLSLPYASINQSIMYQCFSNNILVSAWTVNDYNIAKSLEKLGVAQIYSDILC